MEQLQLDNLYTMQKGFSTLFIVILLGSIGLALTIAISTSSLWSVQSSISTKQNNHAKALVNACAEVALEVMRENNSFIGSATVTIDDNDCEYTVTSGGGNLRTITVTGSVKNITQKLQITSDSFNPLNITTWQEIS